MSNNVQIKIQIEIALLPAETECADLSTALRETMPITHLLKETSTVMDKLTCNKTIEHTVFEDDNGAIDLSKAPKIIPEIKHVAIKHHHFRSNA